MLESLGDKFICSSCLMLHASVGDCRSLKRVENAVSSFALLPVGSVGWAWAGKGVGGWLD